MDESPEERPKRQKRDSSYKAKAFERFKQLKSGGRKKYEVEELENVYETVDEKEYAKQVYDRQEDWIVDDDGSGYIEDGRDIFDDDLDHESINNAVASKQNKGVKRKKKAVSDHVKKGNLQQMFSNMPQKKKEAKKLDSDDTLAELLEELDESPSTSKSGALKPKSLNSSIINQKLAAKNYMKSFSAPLNTTTVQLTPKRIATPIPKRSFKEHKPILNLSQDKSAPIEESSEEITIIENVTQDNLFEDDDLDSVMIEESITQETPKTSVEMEISEDLNDDDFLSEWDAVGEEWEHMQEGVTNDVQPEIEIDNMNIPLVEADSKKVFRFFWWDAFEHSFKQPGVVFLFGKTYCESTKSYVSCCVAVRGIQRKLFVLPRPYKLNSQNNETDEPVTYQDVYDELNTTVMKPLKVKQFRSRFVSKKYAFDPEIPSQSDYMEVRYDGTDPVVNKKSGKTFSKIFGTNTTFLEILLLERKIKGPCWLDISNPKRISNPVSRCKFEVDCLNLNDINVTQSIKPIPAPPLVVAAINMRCAVNPSTLNNEIVMISCLTHNGYSIEKSPPNPPFQQHFCVFTSPNRQLLPLNMYEALKKYKATRVQKMDTEKALINYFIQQFTKIDADLIVGHDLQGYQINVLCDRLIKQDNSNYDKFSRLKRGTPLKGYPIKTLERELFVGRLVCDLKISAKELIKSRSYDLDALCQTILKIKDGQRADLEPDEIIKMYGSADEIIKLISLTMQDTAYILRMMYDLNVLPLAIQITNIAGNVMARTLMGGRSERNEFLLLHAFSEKGYIVPDKQYNSNKSNQSVDSERSTTASRKKPTYSGGLVLDPKIGFYDKLILLMDFNSLYPSIIQEYNICFTTMPPTNLSDDNMVLPDRNIPPGILPTEIRKLVESRREVKKLMNNPDISPDLRLQYHIRQMALKLTANSMYGCLGFSNSRFYAKNLAALVTYKGREILTNTRDLVEKMCYEVVYGDTDSIMINTNSTDYDQVFKVGHKIKQEINKMYKQVELDIDGVFKYLLLLKKKKYAAVTLTKNKSGELHEEREYKGLDIVRRDWSQLAAEAGKFILEHILSELSPDDRINNIHGHLTKLRDDLNDNKVPLQLLIITKTLSKDPKMYTDRNILPHVQVALRYNKNSGGHLRAGDTVPYVICDDGTDKSATQRAYHVEEFKNNIDTNLKIDINYYLSQQIHPVVSRICEPIEGTDAFQIAECLGIDASSFKRTKQNKQQNLDHYNFVRPEIQFKNVSDFVFKCLNCKEDNRINGPFKSNVPFLEKCDNSECNARPIDYFYYVVNQLTANIKDFIKKYYSNALICEDPGCPNETTRRIPLRFVGKFPVCTLCKKALMYRKYTEYNLYTQLTFFQHIFDIQQLTKKPLMEQSTELGYHKLRENVEGFLNHSSFSVIDLTELFTGFFLKDSKVSRDEVVYLNEREEEEDEI